MAAGGDPATSIYAPVWRMHGWDGTAPVRRVEARGNRRALHLHDAETGEVFDLSDPAALLDQEALSRFWLEATHRRRLVLPTRSRPSRCPLDPRWEAIQGAACIAPDTGRLRKLAPRLRELSLREHEHRARRKLCLAIADSIAVAEELGLHQRVHALRMLAEAVVDVDVLESALERRIGHASRHFDGHTVAADQHFPGNGPKEDDWELR